MAGEGNENSTEKKHKVAVRTIRHLMVSGEIGTTPSKRGKRPKISREFLKRFKDNDSLFTKIGTDDLKHLVRFLCYVKKTKGDTFSKHSGNKKKMQEWIAGGEPLWTSYFASPVAKETDEEPAESGSEKSNIKHYLDNENENENINDIIEHQGC